MNWPAVFIYAVVAIWIIQNAARPYRWYRNRFIDKAFKQLEATSRASTKLSPGYEKRRVRELRHARAKFERNGG